MAYMYAVVWSVVIMDFDFYTETLKICVRGRSGGRRRPAMPATVMALYSYDKNVKRLNDPTNKSDIQVELASYTSTEYECDAAATPTPSPPARWQRAMRLVWGQCRGCSREEKAGRAARSLTAERDNKKIRTYTGRCENEDKQSEARVI